MRPFTVLIGIVSGSSASITVALGAAQALLATPGGKHPDLEHELPCWVGSWLAFALLTGASAGSFLGSDRPRSAPRRWWAHAEPPPACDRDSVVLAAPGMRHRRHGARRAPAAAGWLPAPLLAALLAACAAQHKGPPPSTEIDEAGYRDGVRTLASDDFQGRKPGTAGEDKTVAYISGQFRKLNLKPGNGDSYVQQVPLVEILASADATLSVTGRGGALALHYGKNMVIWTRRLVPAAKLEHSGLIFVGYGIVAPDYAWNDYAGVDVRDKTVLILDGDPGTAGGNSALFKGAAMSRYGRWAYKFDEAARHGAAGVLLVHDPRTAGYDWNVVVNRWSGPQLDRARADDNAGGPAVEGWISSEASRGLFAAAGLDLDAATAAAARPGFKATSMGQNVDASLHNSIRRLTSENLIALLPGSDRKHEYVLYTAHWDQLGHDASGAVQHGAVANATGVAGLLMLAQSFSRTRPPPDRSIAFIAFTATEGGLLGSRYYVENPMFPLHDTAGVINLDALHIGGRTRDFMVIGAGNSELEEYVRAAALLQGREVSHEVHPEQGWYYRSDQFIFALHGVPALYVKAGMDDSARGPAWGQAQLDDYMAHSYLKPADKYSEEWDVRGALEDLALYYAVGDRLARTRRFPRFYPGSEFSAAHEPSAGSE